MAHVDLLMRMQAFHPVQGFVRKTGVTVDLSFRIVREARGRAMELGFKQR
jgi:hypothetical protein